MVLRLLPLTLAVAFCASAQNPPDAAAQQALIARMRDAAVNYAGRLQDFLCTQVTTRSVDASGSGQHWKLLETQEMELGYIAHKEHYSLLKVNGKTSGLEKRVKKGYFSPGGEFGSSLQKIFSPQAAAEFTWHREEADSGKRTCVFRYRVPQATSTLIMTADLDRVKMAHHGFVSADCETGMVTRIQIESEPASVKRRGRDQAIGLQLDVRYAPAAVASKEFLLPRQATEIVPFGKTLTKVDILFQNYRKYYSDSSITFDDGAIPAQPVKHVNPPDVIK